MRMVDVVFALRKKVPVHLGDGLPWQVVDINPLARESTRLYPLAGQNDGQPRNVGEAEIKGFCSLQREKPSPVSGLSTK